MRLRMRQGGLAGAVIAAITGGGAGSLTACNFLVGVGDYSVADGSTDDATSTDAGEAAPPTRPPLACR